MNPPQTLSAARLAFAYNTEVLMGMILPGWYTVPGRVMFRMRFKDAWEAYDLIWPASNLDADHRTLFIRLSMANAINCDINDWKKTNPQLVAGVAEMCGQYAWLCSLVVAMGPEYAAMLTPEDLSQT